MSPFSWEKENMGFSEMEKTQQRLPMNPDAAENGECSGITSNGSTKQAREVFSPKPGHFPYDGTILPHAGMHQEKGVRLPLRREIPGCSSTSPSMYTKNGELVSRQMLLDSNSLPALPASMASVDQKHLEDHTVPIPAAHRPRESQISEETRNLQVQAHGPQH